jgi:hypothetical protein
VLVRQLELHLVSIKAHELISFIKQQMPSSGIAINDECIKAFRSLSDYTYIIFAIKNNPSTNKQEVQIEKFGNRDSTYDEFLQQFPEKENRYAAVHLQYERPVVNGISEGTRVKSAFVSWNPSSANIKSKFTYAATKQSVKDCLKGINIEVAAGTLDNLQREALIERCMLVSQ